MNLYIDHNVLDALSKKHFSLEIPEGAVWIYSHETFNEIKRSGDRRFLSVLKELKAQKIELILDENFRIVGDAFIHDYRDPEEFYELWLEAISQHPIDESLHLEFLGRLFGADNHESILEHPQRFKKQIEDILSPLGLYTEEMHSIVENVSTDLNEITSTTMQDVKELEHTRNMMGTSRGRASNLSSNDNPLKEIWKLIEPSCVGSTSDQFFGFDPIDKQGYEKWPLYLGLVGCHTVLNLLGFKADKGLSKVADLPGILSDGVHTAIASYCDAVVSRDKRFCAKAKAIYSFKNINTEVIQLK